MEDIRKDLRDKGKALGIKITEGQAEQFQTYMELLLEWTIFSKWNNVRHTAILNY